MTKQLIGEPVTRLYGIGEGKSILIIGNGDSRKDVNLDELSKKYDATIGCNVIYLEFFPTYITTLGSAIGHDYLRHKVWEKCIVIHKTIFKSKPHIADISKFYFYRQDRFRHCGLAALTFALRMKYSKIHFIGFDMNTTSMYREKSKYYRTWEANLTELDRWKEQFEEIIKKYSEISWGQIGNDIFSCEVIK